MLDVSFWLLNADGSYRCPLPDHAGWRLSPIAFEPGGVELDYPQTGRNFDALREHADADRDALIAVWLDGSADTAERVLLQADDADAIAEAPVWTFSGHYENVRMGDAVVAPDPDDPEGETRLLSLTAGEIVGQLMQTAQARGTLADLDWSSFDDATDSNGVPWSSIITLRLSPGTSYQKVMGSLVEARMCEWRIRNGAVLLYEPDTMGVDHAAGDPPLVLRWGRDLTDAPRKHTVEDAATDLLLAGDEGLYRTVFDQDARNRRGRQIERYQSQGNLVDEGSLLAYGQAKLGQLVNGTTEVTHGLRISDVSPAPLLEYRPTDWLYSDTGRPELERLQVRQVELRQDAGGLRSGSVKLNDLIASRAAQLAEQIDGIAGGTTITGTSQKRITPDQLNDDLAPAAPAGVVVNSSAYDGPQGQPRAALVVGWAAVTTNADGTVLEDLAAYRVQYRYVSGVTTGFIAAGDFDTESADVAPVEPGRDVSVRVAALDRDGNLSAWSAEATHTITTDNDGPGVASAADLSNTYLGILGVTYDGLTDQAAPMAGDFRRARIHVSTTDGFDPGAADDPTYAAELFGAGTTAVNLGADFYGVTVFVRLVAEDRSGNASPAGPQSSVTLRQAQDGDIAGLTVGKLMTGILDALVTVSGVIQTAETGSRVRLDQAGFRCVDDTETERLVYDIASGVLRLVGEFIAQGDGDARIEITPGSLPSINLYSPNGLFGPAFLNAFDFGDVGQTGLGINSSNSDDTAARYYSRVFLSPSSTQFGYVDAQQVPDGGIVRLARDIARIGVSEPDGAGGTRNAGGFVTLARDTTGATIFGQQYGGGSVSSMQINTDGTISVFVNGDQELRLVGGAAEADRFSGYNGGRATFVTGGTGPDVFFYYQGDGTLSIGSASSFIKNFTIPHPLDAERWLVHGCTESPHAGVEYWGTATVRGGWAWVELPAYFEALTRTEDRAVQVTALDPPVRRWWRRAPSVSATYPRHGGFWVRGRGLADGGRVSWLVKAVRADVDRLDPEPRRDAVDVGGIGPYTFVRPKEGAE